MEKKNPILSVVVLLVIVAIAVGVLFMLFKPADTGSTTGQQTATTTPAALGTGSPSVTATVDKTTTPAVTLTGTVNPSATPMAGCAVVAAVTGATPPATWKPVENSTQGFTAYRPTGFYFRLFPPDMFMLSIDPNPIPTASEYMGVINIIRLSASNNFESYLANLETGYQTCTREIDGRTWTTVVGKTKTTDAFEGKFVKYGKVTVGTKEYLARLENLKADYGGYSGQYETFITTLQFK
jgi:hypothetical protein